MTDKRYETKQKNHKCTKCKRVKYEKYTKFSYGINTFDSCTAGFIGLPD